MNRRSFIGRALAAIGALIGLGTAKGEAKAGHHAKHTLLICDEASGLDDDVYTQGATWANHMLMIRNPHECRNFYRRGVEAGDVKADSNGHYFSTVIYHPEAANDA